MVKVVGKAGVHMMKESGSGICHSECVCSYSCSNISSRLLSFDMTYCYDRVAAPEISIITASKNLSLMCGGVIINKVQN